MNRRPDTDLFMVPPSRSACVPLRVGSGRVSNVFDLSWRQTHAQSVSTRSSCIPPASLDRRATRPGQLPTDLFRAIVPRKGRMMSSADESPLFCDHCSTVLTPGRGNFYVVKIEAMADPTPPAFTEGLRARDIGREIDRLIARMRDM